MCIHTYIYTRLYIHTRTRFLDLSLAHTHTNSDSICIIIYIWNNSYNQFLVFVFDLKITKTQNKQLWMYTVGKNPLFASHCCNGCWPCFFRCTIKVYAYSHIRKRATLSSLDMRRTWSCDCQVFSPYVWVRHETHMNTHMPTHTYGYISLYFPCVFMQVCICRRCVTTLVTIRYVVMYVYIHQYFYACMLNRYMFGVGMYGLRCDWGFRTRHGNRSDDKLHILYMYVHTYIYIYI